MLFCFDFRALASGIKSASESESRVSLTSVLSSTSMGSSSQSFSVTTRTAFNSVSLLTNEKERKKERRKKERRKMNVSDDKKRGGG